MTPARTPLLLLLVVSFVAVSDGRTCVMSTISDFKGSDEYAYGQFETEDLQECKDSCLADDQCLAAELRATNCFKFSNDTEQISRGSTLALKRCSPGSKAENETVLECSEDFVSSVNTNLVDGLFSVLDTEPDNRQAQCSSLRQFIVEAKELLSQCHKEDDDMDDSSSWKSFQRYTMVSHLKQMGTIHRLLCSTPFGDYEDDFDWQHDSEMPSACNLTNARNMMRSFMVQKIQWDDTPSCSHVTDGMTKLHNEVTGCSWEARSVMTMLMNQVKKLKFVACTPKTCNVVYAHMCLAHADQALPEDYNATDIDSRRVACRNLKYALACAANHTRTCKPDIYSSISDSFAMVQERFRMNDCAEFFPRKTKESCSARRHRGDLREKYGERKSQRESGEYEDEENQTRDVRERDRPTRLVMDGDNDSRQMLEETHLRVGEEGNGDHQTKDARLRGENQRGSEGPHTKDSRQGYLRQESKAMIRARGNAKATFFAREVYRQECRTSTVSRSSSSSSYADFGNGTVVSSSSNSSSVSVSSSCSALNSSESMSLLCLKGNCSGYDCGAENIEQCEPGQYCGYLCELDSEGNCVNYIERGCQDKSFCDAEVADDVSKGCCQGPLCECSCDMTWIRKLLFNETDENGCQSDINVDLLKSLVSRCSPTETKPIIEQVGAMPDTKCLNVAMEIPLVEYSCSSSSCMSLDYLANVCNPNGTASCEQSTVDCYAYNMLKCPFSERISHYTTLSHQLLSCSNSESLVFKANPPFQPCGSVDSSSSRCLLGLLRPNTTERDRLSGVLNCVKDFPDDPYANRTISFLKHLQASLNFSSTALCAEADDLMGLVYQGVAQLFSEEENEALCSQVEEIVTRWAASCVSSSMRESVVANVTSLFDLICQDAPVSKCDLTPIRGCFSALVNASSPEDFQRIEACIEKSFPESLCSDVVRFEVLRTIHAYSNMSYVKEHERPERPERPDDDDCVCDPAAAVHCLIEVHHLALQPTPDWMRVCPMLPDAAECAADYISGCDECKKETVMEIVTGLNSKLEETCKDPPPTICESYKALECISELQKFSIDAESYEDATVCIQITQTQRCVYESTSRCDVATTQGIERRLQYVVSLWEDLVCEPKDILTSCYDLFQQEASEIFNFDLEGIRSQISQAGSVSADISEYLGVCKQVDIAWNCLDSTLTVNEEGAEARIVQSSLSAIVTAARYECKAVRKIEEEVLKCHSCGGEGQHACNREKIEMQECQMNEVCQTISVRNEEFFTVIRKGCKPMDMCQEGCVGNNCTYCCATDMCNSVPNGPIQGSCDVSRFSQCLLTLGINYVNNDTVDCRTAELAQECVQEVTLECELGGNEELASIMRAVKLEQEVQECLIREANQTCSDGPIVTSYSYINSFGSSLKKDDLCRVVQKNRRHVRESLKTCDGKEYERIQIAELSVETLVGDLDCKEVTGEVIEVKCKPASAYTCILTVLNVTDYTDAANFTCDKYKEIKTCMEEQTVECQEGEQMSVILAEQKKLYKQVIDKESCTRVDVKEDKRVDNTTSCVINFMTFDNSTFGEAAEKFRSCLFELDVDAVVTVNLYKQIYLQFVATFAQFINELVIEFDIDTFLINLNSTQCVEQSYVAIVGTTTRVLSAPALPINEREQLCQSADYEVEALASSCKGFDIAPIFSVLDSLREKFLIGYCPEIQPVPRCLISRAEERLTSFSTFFGLGASKSVCLEARSAVEYAVKYTESCDYESLVSFRQRAAFTVDFISQACRDDVELVSWARCSLLSRKDVKGGCDIDNIGDCLDSDISALSCGELEDRAACIFEKTGACENTVVTVNITKEVNAIEECRISGQQTGVATSTSQTIHSCSAIPYECNPDAARQCLVDYVDGQTGDLDVVKACLEQNYHCFSSVVTLLRQNVTQYAVLVSQMLQITPEWTKLECPALIELLTLPSYITGFLDKNTIVSMNLWDICYKLDSIATRISTAWKMYSSAESTKDAMNWFQRSEESIRYTISSLCNNLDFVSQTLEFPEDGENPKCNVVAIKASVDVLIASAVSEYYTPDGFSSVCSLYDNIMKELDSELLIDCSSGFSAQVHFALRAATAILARPCEVPDFNVRRCDVRKVRSCVSELYELHRMVGETASPNDVCKKLDQTQKCVEKFSYKCDSFRHAQIEWIYSTAKSSSSSFYCQTANPEPVCEPEKEEQMEECNISKAQRCSCANLQSQSNPLFDVQKKCRSLLENSECIAKATESCTGKLPRFYMWTEEDVQKTQEKLGCVVDEQVDENKGCVEGCNFRDAQSCFSVFSESISENLWGRVNTKTCKSINELKLCVSRNTKDCDSADSRLFSLKLKETLEYFTGHEDVCVDVLECAITFDSLARQIQNLGDDEKDQDEECICESDEDSSESHDSDSKSESKEQTASKESQESVSKEVSSKEASKEVPSKETSKEVPSKEASKEVPSKEASKEVPSKEASQESVDVSQEITDQDSIDQESTDSLDQDSANIEQGGASSDEGSDDRRRRRKRSTEAESAAVEESASVEQGIEADESAASAESVGDNEESNSNSVDSDANSADSDSNSLDSVSNGETSDSNSMGSSSKSEGEESGSKSGSKEAGSKSDSKEKGHKKCVCKSRKPKHSKERSSEEKGSGSKSSSKETNSKTSSVEVPSGGVSKASGSESQESASVDKESVSIEQGSVSSDEGSDDKKRRRKRSTEAESAAESASLDADVEQGNDDEDQDSASTESGSKEATGTASTSKETGSAGASKETGSAGASKESGSAGASKEAGSTGASKESNSMGSSEEKGSHESGSHEKERPSPQDPNLTDLCAKARRAWKCLESGLQTLAQPKRKILTALYTITWEAVQEKCYDTKPLRCYDCKGVDNFDECLEKTRQCPHDRQACFVEEKISGNSRKYTAKCRNPRLCALNQQDGVVDSWCCYGHLCNDRSLIGGVKDEEQTSFCDYGYSMECALDFTRSYIQSDSVNCNSALSDLRCIQRHNVTCGVGQQLSDTANAVFMELAKSTCVVEQPDEDPEDPEECYSLAIYSMQTILSNAYSTEGNTVCVGLEQTRSSVDYLISTGQCSSASVANLKQVLVFVESIASSYCDLDTCVPVGMEMTTQLLVDVPVCSGEIFKGVMLIYDGYAEMQKNASERDCGLLSTTSLKANRYLENCGMSNIVLNKLQGLSDFVTTECAESSVLPKIPQGCVNKCNSQEFVSYMEQVSAVSLTVTESDTTSCWHMSQVQIAYNSLTVGCTSVQQADLVALANSMFVQTISVCQEIVPSFSFSLEIRRDIYYSAVTCKMTLETGIEMAFATFDQQMLCDTIDAFNQCDYSLPATIEDLVMENSRELVRSLEALNVCGIDQSQTTTRVKRQSGNCSDVDFQALVRGLNDLPDIQTVPIETRDTACRGSNIVVEKAQTASVECSSGIPFFFKSVFEVLIENVVERNSKLCLKLHYEKEQCNLDLIDDCWSDFDNVCLYAAVEDGTLCRRAKFSLECTYRFTNGCAEAEQVRSSAREQVKSIVGNNCPLLTSYLYCGEPVDSNKVACDFDSDVVAVCAEGLIDSYWSDASEDVRCPSLKSNATCVQSAVTGCEKSVIESQEWLPRIPDSIEDGTCDIFDFNKEEFCTSEPVCDTQSLANCFTNLPNSCSDLSETIDCMTSFTEDNPQCGNSVQKWLMDKSLEMNVQNLLTSCTEITLVIVQPSNLIGSCFETLSGGLQQALTSSLGSGPQMFYTALSEYKTCLEGEVSVDRMTLRMLLEVVSLINIPQVDSVNVTDTDVFQDTDDCVYSRAISCISYEIMSTLSVKLSTSNEKERLCNSAYQSSSSKCVESAMLDCPAGHLERFMEVQSVSQSITETVGLCATPRLCIISEAYECVNKYGAVLSAYDYNRDLKALCLARYEGEQCLATYLDSCASDQKDLVRAEFNTLLERVTQNCDAIEPPKSPICPDIPESSRVCHLGNAFRCMASFNLRILNTGDSLIWRQQCLNLQSMMVCVATNTTSCDMESEDVKTILESLDALRTASSYRCPFLTNDMCSKEKPCPVTSAGCEIALEQGLVNREKTVCELRSEAYECVEQNSLTCNSAQRNQALEIMDSKLETVGIPTELSCANGSIDSVVYGAVSAIRRFGIDADIEKTCNNITNSMTALEQAFSNPDQNDFLTIGKSLLDALNNVLCGESSACQSEELHCIRGVTTLVSNLMLNQDFTDSSFCAQAFEFVQVKASHTCLDPVRQVLSESNHYQSKCVYVEPECSVVNATINSCIANINVSDKDNCQVAAEKARCISSNAISSCSLEAQWISDLCNDTVILQSLNRTSTSTFISEAGSSTVFKWISAAAGSKKFKMSVHAEPVQENNVPRCLKGSNIDEVIPQVYTSQSIVTFNEQTNEVQIDINALQDYRIDGNQEVNLYFRVTPYTEDVQGEEVVETLIEEHAYTLPAVKISVEDRDLSQSMCSSINDPHISTWDNTKYNNMGTGSYILYRNTRYAAAVVAEYKQCAQFGTCNCGVSVYAGDSRLIYDLCDDSTETMSFVPNSASDNADQQFIRVIKKEDVKTVHVVMLTTGTVVTIKSDGAYINLWIMPSARDFGLTQGLCGVFDGDGYNDFEAPDFSQYVLTEKDNQFNVLSPVDFNNLWKISTADAEDMTKVYAPGVNGSLVEARSYFVEWTQDGVTTRQSGQIGHLASCGFIDGEDITSQLLESNNQVGEQQAQKRRKRQATASDSDILPQEARWPTPSGKTLEWATDYCMSALDNEVLTSCSEALFSIENFKNTPRFNSLVDDCIFDIKASDDTQWVEGSKQAVVQMCLEELNKNPAYQNNTASRDLASAFIDKTCTPFDCNKRGTCSRGQCLCDPNYVGTGCEQHVSQLRPPTLITPDEGFSMCQIGHHYNCSALYIRGKNFVNSRFLTCHFRDVEITATGVSPMSSSKEMTVKAELISLDQVRCDLGERRYTKRSVQVYVSNDGQLKSSTYQTFVAFDPMCHSCNSYSCMDKTDVCTIGTKCMRSGEVSIYDQCLYCNLDNPTQWSVRSDLKHCKNRLNNDINDEDDEVMLRNALIGAGIALLLVVVILVIALVLVIKRRGAQRRSHQGQPPAYDNQGYSMHDVFHGQPIPAYSNEQGIGNNLSKTKFPESP